MIDRADFITGLRQLADLLEQHDDIPLPYDGITVPISIYDFWPDTDQNRSRAALFARAFPGSVDKEFDGTRFRLHGQLAGLRVEYVTYREAVCTKRVVGTKVVEVEEREGEDTRPVVTRQLEQEMVEWECSPILALDEAAS